MALCITWPFLGRLQWKKTHKLPLLLEAGFMTRITHQLSRGLVPVLWVPLLVLKELESCLTRLIRIVCKLTVHRL